MNAVINIYLAEWYHCPAGETFRIAREPFKVEVAFEPLPDRDVLIDGVGARRRRGGAVVHQTIGALGGCLRRCGGKVFLGTTARHTIGPDDVRLFLRQGGQDLWKLGPDRAGEALRVPSAEGEVVRAGPLMEVTFGPPVVAASAPTRQLALFAEEA